MNEDSNRCLVYDHILAAAFRRIIRSSEAIVINFKQVYVFLDLNLINNQHDPLQLNVLYPYFLWLKADHLSFCSMLDSN